MWQAEQIRKGGSHLLISKEITTRTTEKITVRVEESKALVLLDKEKETEAIRELLKAADTLVSLNSKQK